MVLQHHCSTQAQMERLVRLQFQVWLQTSNGLRLELLQLVNTCCCRHIDVSGPVSPFMLETTHAAAMFRGIIHHILDELLGLGLLGAQQGGCFG